METAEISHRTSPDHKTTGFHSPEVPGTFGERALPMEGLGPNLLLSTVKVTGCPGVEAVNPNQPAVATGAAEHLQSGSSNPDVLGQYSTH